MAMAMTVVRPTHCAILKPVLKHNLVEFSALSIARHRVGVIVQKCNGGIFVSLKPILSENLVKILLAVFLRELQ